MGGLHSIKTEMVYGWTAHNTLTARCACGPDGGTAYVLYRKDRIEYPKGPRLLRGLKLRDESSTRRVIALCCASPMFLDFEKGH